MSSTNIQDIVVKSGNEYMNSIFIPYEEIESATNNFADANLIAQGTCYMVYKGQLLLSGDLINIVARKCLQYGVGLNESMMCRYLDNKNISSIFKFTANTVNYILINKHEANGSLDKHLSGSTLTWMQRLHICLGVAHALSYIHYHVEDDHYFIHGNIKSSKILLDDNWEPKLHGFGLATKVSRNHGYLTCKCNSTFEYKDPAYENTKTLTYKSDVFSFGIVLFEVLFGTIASIQNEDNWYFARLARLHYEEETLDDMIDSDLRKQMNLQSLKIFSELAYCCLKELQGERPAIDQIVKKLEKALEHQQKHQTQLEARILQSTGGKLSNHLKGKNLDYLKVRLSDIELATNKFSKAKCIGYGGYGMVYKAELEHFDGGKLPAMERKNSNEFLEFPKRRSTVAIKLLFNRIDGQGEEGFFAEIEMLSKCNHSNIVSLLGFCEEGRDQILIYEYVTNGSLSDYLGNVNKMTNLAWSRRLQICLDIANGLNYLHTSTQEKPMIIHRDIKSDNILLDDNWVAKIADFGLSKLRPADVIASTINTVNIAGTKVYLDPMYLETGKLKTASDIYSFGVVLFEIICGRLAYDEIYNENGLPSTVRHYFIEGRLKEIVDPKLKETHENMFLLNGGLNHDSLDTFLTIAYQCLAYTQAERPTTEVIIRELEKALNLQKNNKDNLHISLEVIKAATKNFSEDKCIGEGRYWKQYEGEIPRDNGCNTVVVKRWDSKSDKGSNQFLRELKILFEYKHENIIALAGYCNEMDENIIVYEYGSNGSLDKHLDNTSLTWMKRLKICINVASGLAFLFSKDMIHGDIKTDSIVIDGDWKAKISNLELATDNWDFGEYEHVTRSLSYMDPLYKIESYKTSKSDVYSLGVVFIEILSGRLTWASEESASDLVRKCKQSAEAFDELVFADIKQHSAPESLTTFFELAGACLAPEIQDRPNPYDVVKQLVKAFKLQEDYEIWEPKLPTDYKEICLMSKTPEIYSNETKKHLYDLFTEGILLQQGKLWFILSGDGERNEMISATKFLYKNHWLRKWKSIPESRFEKVAQMLDISNLKIQIKIKTQLLPPGVNCLVRLVLSFGRPIRTTAKWVYVNLKYKMRNENFHAYFARRTVNGWMTIELFRLLNYKNDTDFEVLLESFSRCYCGRRVIYVEGIMFQEIDNTKYEESDNLDNVQQVLKSYSNFDEVQPSPIDSQEILKRFGNDEGIKKVIHSLLSDDAQLFLFNQVNGKNHLMLSAIGFLYDTSKVNPFHLKRSTESRFQVVIELLPQQVFGIKCKIGSRFLSPDTDYVCYLVFKLSEKCRGLHCPVKVRNVLWWNKNKETGLVCFRHRSTWTLFIDTNWVPKQRKDGWMEVIVWKFNSTSDIKNDCIPMHLKLITYEGNMSGLIISGLEIRTTAS